MDQEEKPKLKNIKGLSLSLSGNSTENEKQSFEENPKSSGLPEKSPALTSGVNNNKESSEKTDADTGNKDILEKTLKLSLGNSKPTAVNNEVKSSTPRFDQTIKLKLGNKQAGASTVEVTQKDESDKHLIEKTIKLQPNIVNTNPSLKAVKDNIAENQKDPNSRLSSIIDKTIKLRVNSDKDPAEEPQKSSVSELAKTLKLKFKNESSASNTENEPALPKTEANSLSDLTSTLKLNKIVKNTEDSADKEEKQNISNTVKLKMPESRNVESATSILTKTLKLKKDFLNSGDNSKKENNNPSLPSISATKDVSSSKIIQLKPTIKPDEEKVDPLKTQTIKIKIAKDNTVKIPKINLEEKQSENKESEKEDLATTRKISLTKDLPAIDNNTIKIEHEEQSKIYGTIKIDKKDQVIEREEPVKLGLKQEKEEINVDDIVITEDDDDITEKMNTEKPISSQANKSEKTVPDLDELKDVLEDLKRAKNNKLKSKSTVSQKAIKEDAVIIEEESSTSIFSISLCSATLLGIIVFLYFTITSYFSIT